MNLIKAIGLLLAAVLIAVLACGTAHAGINVEKEFAYKIKKGDTLSEIAKKYNCYVSEIQNKNPEKIRNINKIYAGNTIIIPSIYERFSYKYPGKDKYRGTPEKALKLFKETEKEAFLEKIRNEEYQEDFLYQGEEGAMVFGEDKVRFKTVVETEKVLTARVYKEAEKVLKYIYACGNWFRPEEKIVSPEKTEESAKVTEAEIQEKGQVKQTDTQTPRPDVTDVKKGDEKESQEAPKITEVKKVESKRKVIENIMGAVYYQNSHSNQDAKGYAWWDKTRWRPISANLGKGYEFAIGGVVFIALGAGHDRDFHYNWWERAGGFTQKFVGPHFDIDMDEMFGSLDNQGGIDKYRSRQEENIFDLSGHFNWYARRDAGYKLIPKVEINLEARWPYNTHHEHSWAGDKLKPNPADNRRWEVSLTPWIYDFEVKKHILITPGVSLAYGREYWVDNNRGKDYIQFGPTVQFTAFDEAVAQMSVFNYKEQLRHDGDQWLPISGWISFDSAYRAYKAAKIHYATIKEIKERRIIINHPDAPKF